MGEEIREYEYEYNKNGYEVYFRGFNGHEHWKEYDEDNNLVHFKDSDGSESWFKWKENERTRITKNEFEQIKEKEFLSREYVSRFELMEI
jgi:YD repeat-containing protein